MLFSCLSSKEFLQPHLTTILGSLHLMKYGYKDPVPLANLGITMKVQSQPHYILGSSESFAVIAAWTNFLFCPILLYFLPTLA